jgi:hypothetical protein
MLLEHFEDFYKFCQIWGEKQVCCDLKMIEKQGKFQKVPNQKFVKNIL